MRLRNSGSKPSGKPPVDNNDAIKAAFDKNGRKVQSAETACRIPRKDVSRHHPSTDINRHNAKIAEDSVRSEKGDQDKPETLIAELQLRIAESASDEELHEILEQCYQL